MGQLLYWLNKCHLMSFKRNCKREEDFYWCLTGQKLYKLCLEDTLKQNLPSRDSHRVILPKSVGQNRQQTIKRSSKLLVNSKIKLRVEKLENFHSDNSSWPKEQFPNIASKFPVLDIWWSDDILYFSSGGQLIQ